MRQRKIKKPLIIRRVVGHSMVPTLPPRTLVIGTGLIKNIKPGHVVVIKHKGKEKIKRIDEIKDDTVFILGDHPETSTDSRHFGWLPVQDITAVIIWPKTKT